MESINKIKLYDFDKLTFDNVNIVSAEIVSLITQSASLEYTLRNDVLNYVYSEYKRLCNNQCDELILKSMQTLVTYHLMSMLLEQRTKIEQIKKQIINI